VDRLLEVVAVGTSSLVLSVLGVLGYSHATGTLSRTFPDIGTASATLLFAYLWLLTLVAASQGTVVGLDSARWSGLVADAAMVASGVTLVFLTVALVVGFVTPVTAPIDPATVSVAWLVGGGVVGGGLAGALFGVYFLCCDRLAARLTRGE